MKTLILLLCLFILPAGEAADKPIRKHAFGWKGDAPGKKATPFRLSPKYSQMQISVKSDLSNLMPPIQDQGTVGSCTGNGIGRILDYAHKKATGRFFTPSRLFIYYNERVMEGTVYEDAGAQIVDGIKSVMQLGACVEGICTLYGQWPYEVDKFAVKPPDIAYQKALNYQALHAYKVNNADGRSIRMALSNGLPVVFGALVYPDIERLNAQRYVLSMPKKGEMYIGGHCMVITGHNDGTQLYLVDNSWGTSWGLRGRCYIPYAYIHNARITEDCWVIETAE